ncbi:hypothetical protein [Streptomyces sp. A5-4]|uniref:hypothetical protein n=1 Tax=Streptomyces sp. A5-4 TaxID=3384771 RepID=UPI003DA9DBCE
MNPRHATHSPSTRDPLGIVLGWLWALGMAAGFISLAATVDSALADRGAHAPTLTMPDPGATLLQNSPPA